MNFFYWCTEIKDSWATYGVRAADEKDPAHEIVTRTFVFTRDVNSSSKSWAGESFLTICVEDPKLFDQFSIGKRYAMSFALAAQVT